MERTKITRYGRITPKVSKEAMAILFQIRQEIDDFIEESEILKDPELIRDIRNGLRDIEGGNVTEIKDIDDLDRFFDKDG